MGQKINPIGLRLGINRTWDSRWYAGKKDFGKYLLQDKHIRDHVVKEFGSAGIPRIEIERTTDAVNVIIYTARPGVLVDRKGVRVDDWVFGVSSVSKDGFESPVASAVPGGAFKPWVKPAEPAN